MEEKELPDTAEPVTLMSANQAGKNDQDKKPSKPKLTKAEKALARLDRAAAELKGNQEYFALFLSRIDKWLKKNASKAISLYQMVDRGGEGMVDVETFKAGLLDLNLLVNQTELHLLTQLLGKDERGQICYVSLSKGLESAIHMEEKERSEEFDSQRLILSEISTSPCAGCLMGISYPGHKEKNPKFILLELRLASLDTKFTKHPCHITELVHAHLPVCGLADIVVRETNIASSNIVFFFDKSKTKKSYLSPQATLEECGITGGPQHSPEPFLLFYDYPNHMTECSLLKCDYYFGEKIKLF